ncbi:MAG TPA: hypothetical protein VJ894_05265, partial [Cryomorphaceae bacterium]|nr:hypothetical protein [Cryomorphaceae bacterium]
MKQTLLTTVFLFVIGIAWAGNPNSSPKAFVKNEGQVRTTSGIANSDVKYLWSSRAGLNVQFKNNGLSFDTYSRCEVDNSFLFHRMDMSFIDGNSAAQLLSRNRLEEELNIIKGNKRFEKIGLFEELVYKNIYDNIDIVAYSGGTHFKYDFVLREGAKSGDIKMEYKGFDSYHADEGKITFYLSGKALTENIPESWLTETGERIAVEYQIIEESENSVILGFEVCDDSFNGDKMTIDPEVVPEWSTYHGDSLFDMANDIVTDMHGIIFIAGTSQSLETI